MSDSYFREKLYLFPLMCFLSVILVLSLFSFAVTTVLANPDNTTLYTTADTWIDEGAPDANKGGLTYMFIQTLNTPRNMRVFIKFDLSSLPEGAVISLAKLRMNCYYVGDPHTPDTDVQARRVADDSWEELVITWNNQKAYGDVEDTKTPAVGWVEWDIVDFVQAELAGDEVVSLCLRSVTESYDATTRRHCYYSKEYDGSDPELYIEYTIVEEETFFITFQVNIGGTFEINGTVKTNSTVSEYDNQTILALRGIVENASFGWVNFSWDIETSTINNYNYTVSENMTILCNFGAAADLTDVADVVEWVLVALIGVPLLLLLGYRVLKRKR